MTGGVRTIVASELEDWLRCAGVGFFVDFAEGYAEYFAGDVDLARTWGAVDDGRVVGTLRSFPTHLTVPGPAPVAAAALTNVTVAPTHRRRGLLTEMITADLRASAERGEPLGILIASEYPIYGRFGYGAAADMASYSIDTRSTRFRRPPVGHVELVDRATLRHEAPALYDRFHDRQPGSIDRSPRWWDRALHQVEVPGADAPKGYAALYRSPQGEPEGYVRYQAKQRWDDMRPNGLLTVDELLATTSDAYRALWQFCCQVDLVSCVEAGNRSVDEALPWLLEDARTVRQSGRFDFLWVRILDVGAALTARRYGAEGRIVIEVVDPLGPAAGRYALDVGPDGASCTPSEHSAELTVPVASLGSLFLGGVAAATLHGAGRIDEHRPGALERAGAVFRSGPTPWCSTWF